ncbi:MAG: LuxR C-terminal-related transcriptional regulator [Acidimicrobiia bacterium]
MTTIAIQIAAPLVRAGICSRLAAVDDLTVAGAAGTIADLVETLADAIGDVDVVLMECDGPDADARVAYLLETMSGVGIVGLHSDLPSARIAELREAGVRCLVDRASGIASLADALLDPLRATRRRWLAPTIGPLPLSDRESQVLAFISEGRTAKEIADALGISGRTVEAHKQRAYAKLGVQNQAHAVSAALRGKQLPAPTLVDAQVWPVNESPVAS